MGTNLRKAGKETMAEKGIKIHQVGKTYDVKGKANQVLDHINLEITPGEFVCILGHSGCGKSTLIRMIAGLEEYQSGEILLDGENIDVPNTKRGMVFQDHRLLPWLSVYDNLAFGYYEEDKEKKKENILQHLRLVGLEEYKDIYPNQLSGGMSQRASIARALIHKPEVLLLDEPFGALDALTRMQMQKEILRIWKQEKTTMIMVTHDIEEAIYLSDHIVILEGKPATVKTVIPVEMGRPRNRTSYDFDQIRKKVYQEFFGIEEIEIEYQI